MREPTTISVARGCRALEYRASEDAKAQAGSPTAATFEKAATEYAKLAAKFEAATAERSGSS